MASSNDGTCDPLQIRVGSLVTVLIGVRVPDFGFLSVGLVLATLLTPFLIAARPRPVILVRLWTLALISAGILALWVPRGLGEVDGLSAVQHAAWLTSILMGAICVSWAVKGSYFVRVLVAASGLGVVSNLLNDAPADNLWKFALSGGVSIVVLTLAAKSRFWIGPLVCLIVVSLVFDTRSVALQLILTLLTVIFLGRSRERGLRSSIRLAGVVLVSIGGLTYAMSSGLLGRGLQRLYLLQVGESGNLLLGGRQELALAKDLIDFSSFGFGAGVRPSDAVRAYVLDSALRRGADATNSYFVESVLGDRVDLHSALANGWYVAGWLGVAFLLYSGLRICSFLVALGSVSFLPSLTLAFLGWAGLWHLFFSPIQSTEYYVLALGLTLAAGKGTASVSAERVRRSIDLRVDGPAVQ